MCDRLLGDDEDLADLSLISRFDSDVQIFKHDLFIHLGNPAQKVDDEPAHGFKSSLRQLNAEMLFQFFDLQAGIHENGIVIEDGE